MKPTPTPLVILAPLLAERRGEELPAFGEREAGDRLLPGQALIEAAAVAGR